MKKLILKLDNMYMKFIIFILLFTGLAFISFNVDQNIQLSVLSEVLSFSQRFTETLAIMIIGAIITIITITFSSILVVMTLYSGQFSPRTLGDFLQRKVPVNVLAYFIGTSIYALLILVLSSRYELYVYPISALLMMILFALGITIFAYYIQYVSKAIQINIYMDQLVNDSVSKIEEYKKNIFENNRISLLKDEPFDLEDTKEFKTPVSGYFIEINYDKLLKYLMEEDAFMKVAISFNEHIFEDDLVFEYTSNKKSFKFDEERFEEFFIIADEPKNHEEYLNKTQKLIEIAVRALSPGINDPVTAIGCINQLGFILMKLSDGFDSLVYKDEEDTPRIRLRAIGFEKLLYNHFYQIYLYGHKDLEVLASMIRALTRISTDSDSMMKDAIWNFFLYLIKDIEPEKLHPYDFNLIHIEVRELAHKCRKYEAYKELMDKIKS